MRTRLRRRPDCTPPPFAQFSPCPPTTPHQTALLLLLVRPRSCPTTSPWSNGAVLPSNTVLRPPCDQTVKHHWSLHKAGEGDYGATPSCQRAAGSDGSAEMNCVMTSGASRVNGVVWSAGHFCGICEVCKGGQQDVVSLHRDVTPGFGVLLDSAVKDEMACLHFLCCFFFVHNMQTQVTS